MAIRLNDFVTCGELRNTQRNRVIGWIEFAPDWGIRIELSGNLAGQFEGKHIRFRIPGNLAAKIAIEDLPELIHTMADRQIGYIGDVLLHDRKILTDSVEEHRARTELDEPNPIEVKPVLYLEWYSQQGRIVAELTDPEIEFVSEEESNPRITPDSPTSTPLPEATDTPIDFPSIDELWGANEESETDDPYGLFDKNMEREISRSLNDGEGTDSATEDAGANEERQERSWDEVIPGIDPETKALYEHWDEVYGGTKDEAVTTLFDPPIQLPPLDTIQTDEAAEPHLRLLVSRLAALNVVFDLCEHCTPLSAYRMLVSEILPIAQVHPGIAGSDMFSHYSAYEHCSECEAEFEAEYRERERAKDRDAGIDDSDPDSDVPF